LARLAQAHVTIMDKLPRRLEYARGSLGFDSAVRASDDASGELLQLTGGEMFDCVFDATGSRAAMCSGLQYVCHGGQYVLVSVVQGDISFPDPEFHKRETTLLASRNALTEDFEQVIDLILARSLPAQLLHTHSLSALDAPRRVPELISDIDSVVKAIVTL
jgi:threonine dehydrogenase-like Zn-dependent dehydrogenase